MAADSNDAKCDIDAEPIFGTDPINKTDVKQLSIDSEQSSIDSEQLSIDSKQSTERISMRKLFKTGSAFLFCPGEFILRKTYFVSARAYGAGRDSYVKICYQLSSCSDTEEEVIPGSYHYDAEAILADIYYQLNS